MALTASGIYSGIVKDAFSGSAPGINLTSNANKLCLLKSAATPSYDTASQVYSSISGSEIYGTAWNQGGKTLNDLGGTSPTFNIVTGGVKWTTAALSATGTTIGSETDTANQIFGCAIYADPLTTKYLICAIYFGASGYYTNSGTITITWDTSGGIFTLKTAP